jgi:hypothetical protein
VLSILADAFIKCHPFHLKGYSTSGGRGDIFS